MGEPEAKRVLILAAISRKLPEPLWAIRTASDDLAGSHGLDLIAALTPPEDVIHVSRLTNAALAYQDANALRHRLLVIDEATTLSPELVLALRVLRNRGALSQATVPRHNLSGSARTHVIEVRGPIAVLSATAGRLDRSLLATCCQVPVDESQEQTARVLAAERHRYAHPGGDDLASRTAIIRRHHAAQRLLARRPVVIPFAEKIDFPATTLRHRGEQARILGLVAASALLHQHQRLTDRGHVVADERDFALAVSLAGAAGIGVETGRSRRATELLGLLSALPSSSVTVGDLMRQHPERTRHAFLVALDELADAGLVTATRGGRGRERRYALTLAGRSAAAPDQAVRPGISLRPAGRLAEVGGIDLANFTPDRQSG